MNILIVEDEFLIAFDLQTQLVDLGHVVTGIAKDFATCRAMVEQCEPDLAFMDLRLADGDSGEEVARWLLAEHAVRCVFISGNLDESTRERLENLDPVAMIGKPIFPHSVSQAVATSLSES